MKTRLFWIIGTIAATGVVHLGVILGLASIAGGN
tara:strand:+ start:865 stop:966 length:102 start_codon:yes stop_codon:yes gene_type:complete